MRCLSLLLLMLCGSTAMGQNLIAVNYKEGFFRTYTFDIGPRYQYGEPLDVYRKYDPTAMTITREEWAGVMSAFDWDGDGFNEVEELDAGTDPTDPGSFPETQGGEFAVIVPLDVGSAVGDAAGSLADYLGLLVGVFVGLLVLVAALRLLRGSLSVSLHKASAPNGKMAVAFEGRTARRYRLYRQEMLRKGMEPLTRGDFDALQAEQRHSEVPF